MARRRHRKKQQRAAAAAAPQAADRPAEAPQSPSGGETLVAWRTRMSALRTALREWSHLHYAEAVDAYLRERFEDPDAVEHAQDIDQAIEDFVCSPGSSGTEASILSVWCEQAATGQVESIDGESSTQLRRWERERRRGVFVLQRATRDQLSLWDPLEGAPLTLHLLRKLSAAEVENLERGTVITAVYQPWVARLVAVGTEFFSDPRAIQLFRDQTLDAGRAWHEAPAPAPAPTKKRSEASKS